MQRGASGSSSSTSSPVARAPAEIVPTVGTVLVDRYELIEEIGRGGCAIVFEAHDLRLSRVVAVKVPLGVMGDAAKMSRFLREARVVASIHHPNVCAVLDTGMTEEGLPFLVMERLFGESLRASINRCGFLPLGEAISIGLQLLSALDAVHEAGIVHRDVKPDNIVLVTRGGCDPVVKLLDFGLCRRSATGSHPGSAGSREETMTALGAIVGTPEYMAPEQVLGTAKLDVRVDIYAVGVVLYEALTGDRAFFSKNLRDILSGVMTKQIRPLRHIRRDAPQSLESVIARAMDRRPEYRYQSALELQDHLNAVKDELAALARRRRPRDDEQYGNPERSGAYFAARSSQATSVNGEAPAKPAARVPMNEAPEWELPTTRLNRQIRPPQRPTTGAVAAVPPPLGPRRALTPPAAPRRAAVAPPPLPQRPRYTGTDR